MASYTNVVGLYLSQMLELANTEVLCMVILIKTVFSIMIFLAIKQY